MADFLIVTRRNGGGRQFAVSRGGLPFWWARRGREYGPGGAAMRPLTEDEATWPLDSLVQLWHSERPPQVPPPRTEPLQPPAPSQPEGEFLSLAVLTEMLSWPLLARGMIQPGDTIRLSSVEGGLRLAVKCDR